MAVTKPKKKRVLEEIEESKGKSDLKALVEHVKENPALNAAIVGFVLVVALAGVLYYLHSTTQNIEQTTEYARALNAEDPALRATQLAPIAEGSGRWAPEALYMMGESAYDAEDYEKAESAFQRLRERFPDSKYVPLAVEGLGYIAENRGDYEKALSYYQEVAEKWPDSFAGHCQYLNIGRCHERLEQWREAAEAYETQTSVFPESSVAREAQKALDQLKIAHPDQFPKEDEPEETSEEEKQDQATEAEQAQDDTGEQTGVKGAETDAGKGGPDAEPNGPSDTARDKVKAPKSAETQPGAPEKNSGTE